MQIQTELSDRLKQIAADNARCQADIKELRNRRKFLIESSLPTGEGRGGVLRPGIEEIDAFLLLNQMKLKENMRATQVALSRRESNLN